jgi:hypothetical protein
MAPTVKHPVITSLSPPGKFFGCVANGCDYGPVLFLFGILFKFCPENLNSRVLAIRVRFFSLCFGLIPGFPHMFHIPAPAPGLESLNLLAQV